MQIELIYNPAFDQLEPIKKVKRAITKVLKIEWEKVYRITYTEAIDLISIWNVTPESERPALCKKFSIRPARKLDSFLKQMKSPSRRGISKKWSETELSDLAKQLEILSSTEQLQHLWLLPSRSSLAKKLGLNSKSNLEELLTSLMRFRNLSELSNLASI